MKNSNYLDDYSPLVEQGIFRATVKAHGLYNSFQFVLRLSPLVHQKISSSPGGIQNASTVDFDSVQAFSTLLHETVHWWQHIGSTHGIMLSLSYPTQAYANYKYLKYITDKIGPKKSIRKIAEALPRRVDKDIAESANIILNNHYDIESFQYLTINPMGANKVVNNPLFQNLSHSFNITYANIISLIASSSDRGFSIIPHPKEWEKPLKILRDKKEEGYYYGSPINLYPIGTYDIFEGQARFAQLQYLHFASGGRFEMQDAEDANMFEGVYGRAFDAFIKICGLKKPSSIDDPLVALFMLICDIAINPGSAFPFKLVNFTTLIHDLNPGSRFVYACALARDRCPEVFNEIRDYSRENYESVSAKISKEMIEHSPFEISKEFSLWWGSPLFSNLKNEYETYQFEKTNITVRVLTAHFLSFMEDKYKTPEFFCWPGAWMAGNRLSDDIPALFEKHSALYIDKEDDYGIFPRIPSGRIEANVQETFTDFYANNVVFDLTRQWITEPGSFQYNYRWLSQSNTEEEMREFAELSFKSIYMSKPSDFLIL